MKGDYLKNQTFKILVFKIIYDNINNNYSN